MSELPAGPGWYEDEHDPLLLRYFDGVVWTSNTTPRRSPTAERLDHRAGHPGRDPRPRREPRGMGTARPGVPGTGPVAGRRHAADRLPPVPAGLGAPRAATCCPTAPCSPSGGGGWWAGSSTRHRDRRAHPGPRVPVVGPGVLDDVGLRRRTLQAAAETGAPPPSQTAFASRLRRGHPPGHPDQHRRVAASTRPSSSPPGARPREDGRRHRRASGRQGPDKLTRGRPPSSARPSTVGTSCSAWCPSWGCSRPC